MARHGTPPRTPKCITASRTIDVEGRLFLESGERWESSSYYDLGWSANYVLEVVDFGEIRNAKWGFTISSEGKILPFTTATLDSQQEVSVASTVDASSAVPLPAALDSLLLNELGIRSQYEITSTFPNPTEADALFTQLGWSGSSYEVFVAPGGAPTPDGTYEVDIGIHQLRGSPEAVEALKYFADARVQLLGLWEAPVDPIGNVSKALIGPSGNGGYEASVYVVVGSQVIRVTALSWNDYPLSYAVGVMREVVGG